MRLKKLNQTEPKSEIVIKCAVPAVARWAIGITLVICGIALATGNLNPGFPIGFRCLVWILWVFGYIVYPTDFGFSEQGIVVEKFRRRILISWDNIIQVDRDYINTQVFVDMKPFTRYERFIVSRFSISPLTCLHYREADNFIREKVGNKYHEHRHLLEAD